MLPQQILLLCLHLVTFSISRPRIQMKFYFVYSLKVRFHLVTQFNSSSFMNFECTPSQPKQSPYFKIHGASSMKQAFERGKCYLQRSRKQTLKIHSHVIFTCIITLCNRNSSYKFHKTLK